MSHPTGTASRRTFLGNSAGYFVAGAARPAVRAGIVGVGWRGMPAIVELLSGDDTVELVAIGDLFENNVEKALRTVRDEKKYPAIQSRIKVDRDHIFLGFDAYQKVLASDIDLVMLETPPVYRPLHFEAAVAAKKHIFAEKPLGIDPVGVRRVMAAARKSEELKLTVGVGAQRRSAPEYVGTIEKIRSGAIGEIVAAQAFWLGSPFPRLDRKPDEMNESEFKIRNWPQYVSIGGDQIVEQHIHNLDVMQWVLGRPLKVVASGGRAWLPANDWVYGDKYDHIAAEFTYPNGVVCSSHSRHYPKGCAMRAGELVIGTRGRSNCQDMAPRGRVSPYVQEHTNLIRSIRGEGPYVNLAMAVAESSMMAVMARESAYSGLEITWDMIMASRLEHRAPGAGYTLPPGIAKPAVPGEYQFI
jgi:predicted dehydrogenase